MALSLTPIILVALLEWDLRKFFSRPRLPYPPGPKLKPLIGNTLDISIVKSVETYKEWSEIYKSDIVHAEALGNHIVILNKVEDADELLEKRVANYIDRPVIFSVT
ncbi:hypothetical protein CPC08DRAFT_767375 [Agrocybe pediades]|nr:hypothetical protein CPC08DRAFT_767375 [Agrocybe pediades]